MLGLPNAPKLSVYTRIRFSGRYIPARISSRELMRQHGTHSHCREPPLRPSDTATDPLGSACKCMSMFVRPASTAPRWSAAGHGSPVSSVRVRERTGECPSRVQAVSGTRSARSSQPAMDRRVGASESGQRSRPDSGQSRRPALASRQPRRPTVTLSRTNNIGRHPAIGS